jgi:hypothetical protein
MTPKAAYRCHAPFSWSKIQWKEKMELKQAGDLSLMLSDTEQELRSISQTLEVLALITGKDSLRVARVHLEKSIAALMSS